MKRQPMRTGGQQVKAQVLPVALIFGCHYCEDFAPHPVQWVSVKGKVFIFCDNDCLKRWISDGEERVVREVYDECVSAEEMAEYEEEVKEAFAEETKHYEQYGTLENFRPPKEGW